MKLLNSLLIFCSLVLVFACAEEPLMEGSGEPKSLSIVGIKDAFSYSFHSAAGKSNAVPDEIHTLTVKVVDEFNHMVYEQWYSDWSSEVNEIPDSIFIPSLEPGNYKIYASTAEYYYYYDDYYYYETGDSASYYPGSFVIEPWNSSTNPIYVGNQSFEITEEDVEVALEMRNISAKLTINYSRSSQDMHYGGTLIGPDAYSYSFEEDELFIMYEDNEFYTDLYQYDESTTVNYYFLPRTLEKMRAYVYDYNYNYSVEQTYTFDEPIQMEVGDALTININIDNLLEGGGEASTAWEVIDWNDLGEITIE